MNELLNKLPFKSFDKIKHHIKKQFTDVSDQQIRAALKNRVKDRFIKMKQQKPLMNRIFSSSTGSWFHDLFENGAERLSTRSANSSSFNPKYFHIFIRTNNRFVVAHPLQDKKTETILASYKQFCEKYKPFKLTSDQDSSLLSDASIKYLRSQDILVQSIPDQNHSALAIIDRFIRTLRDWNHRMYRVKNISIEQMTELLDLYNNTVHGSIGMTPKEIFVNRELEEKYKLKMLDLKKPTRKLEEGS